MAEFVATAALAGSGAVAAQPGATRAARSRMRAHSMLSGGIVEARAAALEAAGGVAAKGVRTVETLLPRNRTRFEEAFEQASVRGTALPVPIRDVKKPLKTPLPALPFLAWELSTDLWGKGWLPEKKRAVAQQSISLHRIKGTLAGIKAHVSILGGEVVHAIVPPNKFFPGKSATKAERNAWLATMPQVRIFPFRDKGREHYGAYWNSSYKTGPKAFLGAGAPASPAASGSASVACFFPAATTAPQRLGRNAYAYHMGTEYKLQWRQQQTGLEAIATPAEETLQWPGTRQQVWFAGDKPRAQVVLQRSTAVSRYYTIALDRAGVRFDFHVHAIPAGLKPVSVTPDRIKEKGKAYGLFAGQPLAGEFVDQQAWLRLYESFYLHDKQSLPRKQTRLPHIGFVRLGWPAYHARLDVLYLGRQPFRRFQRFVDGFTVASDPARIASLRQSVVTSKAARDKIWINTRVHRLPRIGDPITVGQYEVGQHIRDY